MLSLQNFRFYLVRDIKNWNFTERKLGPSFIEFKNIKFYVVVILKKRWGVYALKWIRTMNVFNFLNSCFPSSVRFCFLNFCPILFITFRLKESLSPCDKIPCFSIFVFLFSFKLFDDKSELLEYVCLSGKAGKYWGMLECTCSETFENDTWTWVCEWVELLEIENSERVNTFGRRRIVKCFGSGRANGLLSTTSA